MRGSAVGEATIRDPEISLTPPLIFTGWGVKSAKFGIVSTSLDFERPAFENTARYLDSEVNSVSRDDAVCPLQVW